MGNTITEAGRDISRTTKAKKKYDEHKALIDAIGSKLKNGVIAPQEQPNGNKERDESNKLYHESRSKAWAFNSCGYPCAIFLPEDETEVSTIVKGLKGNKDLQLVISGGRHSDACCIDDSVVIDLERISYVKLDLEKKLVKIGGGTKIAKVDEAMKGTGYGFVTGTNGDTGVGGLTLGGGSGFLSPIHGMACDTVVEYRVCLASGEIIVANDMNDFKDLTRGLRGAGFKLGIVLEFTMEVYPVSHCFGGAVAHLAPTQNSKFTVLKEWVKWTKTAPSFAASMCAIPCGAPVIATLVSEIDDSLKDFKSYQEIESLKSFAAIPGGFFKIKNSLKRLDYHDGLQPMIANMVNPPKGNLIPGGFCVKEGSDELMQRLARASSECPNKKTSILLFALTGASRTGIQGRPHVLNYRDNGFWVLIEAGYGVHDPPQQVETLKEWIRQLKADIRRINGTEDEPGPLHPFFDRKTVPQPQEMNELKRFVHSLKLKYDPELLFPQ